MKISIIVPAFNEEQFLGKSLAQIKAAASALANTGWGTELIVCDNNSTDRTAEIARAAGANVVFEPVNQISRARNSGATAATGDWLVFVDADSYPSAGVFADMAKQINLPKIDYEALVDIHRKNFEAMQKSAAVVSQGGRAVLAKQQEILAEVGREARQLIADFKPGGSPQEVAVKQAELAKRVFEATVKNTRDVAELVQKSNSEAPKIILDRMRESFAEARAAIESKEA